MSAVKNIYYNVRKGDGLLVPYIAIIGLVALIGIVIHLNASHGNRAYKTIGAAIILITGIFGCCIFLNAYAFGSFLGLSCFLLLSTVLLVILYMITCCIAYRLLINKRVTGFTAYATENVKEKIEITISQSDQTNEKEKIIPGWSENHYTQCKKMIIPRSAQTVYRSVRRLKTPELIESMGIERITDSMLNIPDEIKTALQNETQSIGDLAENTPVESEIVDQELEDAFKHEEHTKINAAFERFAAIIAKAEELMGQAKYLYAIQLLEACVIGTQHESQQKEANILLLECYVRSNQYRLAQTKWLEIIKKKYALEPAERMKLKEIMTELKAANIQRKV